MDKHKILKVVAFIFVFLSFVGFIVCAKLNFEKLDIPYVGGIFDEVIVNIEVPFQYRDSLKMYTGKGDVPFELNSELRTDRYNVFLHAKTSGKTNLLSLLIPKAYANDIVNSISGIGVYVGQKFYGINKNELFKLDVQEYTYDNNYLELHLDSALRSDLRTMDINYRGHMNTFAVVLLSFIYQLKFYIIPYLLLFIGIIILTRENFKFNIHYGWALGSILALAFLIRFNGYRNIDLWTDELYVMTLIVPLNPNSGWAPLLSDPGNPPLFFLVSKLWQMFWGWSVSSARMLSVVLGVGSVWSIYYLVKSRINEKIGLISALILTFNIYSIAYSQEFRAYILGMFLVPLGAKFLFDVLEKKDLKSYSWFSFITACLLNVHYYTIVFVISNFVYGLTHILLKEVEKKKVALKFLYSHLVAGIFFLPFLICTFFKYAIPDQEFNDWLPAVTGELLNEITSKFFGNLFVFGAIVLVTALFFVIVNNKIIKKELINDISDEHIQLVMYSAITIVFSFVFVIVFSLFRPIIFYFYFSVIYPLLIVLLVSLFFLDWRYKTTMRVITLASLLIILSFQTTNNIFKLRRTFQNMANYIQFDAQIHNYYSAIAMITDNRTYSYNFNTPELRWESFNGQNMESFFVDEYNRVVNNDSQRYEDNVLYINAQEMWKFNLGLLEQARGVINLQDIIMPGDYHILRILY